MITTAPKLTNAGMSLLARAVAGEEITFTRFKAGDGVLPEGETGDSLTDLIDTVLEFSIDDMDTSQHGLVALTGEFDSSSVESAFLWTELGLFAQGEDENEVLYAYANDGEDAGWIRPGDTDVLTIQTVTALIAIGEAENVTAVYSPHTQYASQEDLTNHKNATNNPHSVTKAQVGLGNVMNAAPEDITVTFTEAETRANIATGEKLSVMFGKIKKVFTDTIAHLTSTSNPHGVTYTQAGAAKAQHTHIATDITGGTVPISRGGTGANTAADALESLGIVYSATEPTVIEGGIWLKPVS